MRCEDTRYQRMTSAEQRTHEWVHIDVVPQVLYGRLLALLCLIYLLLHILHRHSYADPYTQDPPRSRAAHLICSTSGQLPVSFLKAHAIRKPWCFSSASLDLHRPLLDPDLASPS